MLDTVLNTFPTLTHLVLIAPLWGSFYYCLHFTNRKTRQKSCHLSRIIQLVEGRVQIWTRQFLYYLLSFWWESWSSSLMAYHPRFCPTQARMSSSMPRPFLQNKAIWTMTNRNTHLKILYTFWQGPRNLDLSFLLAKGNRDTNIHKSPNVHIIKSKQLLRRNIAFPGIETIKEILSVDSH